MKLSFPLVFVLVWPIWTALSAPILLPRKGELPRPPAEITETVQAVAAALEGEHYAISGGAALNLLGSTRRTGDVDIYTPTGMKRRFKTLLLRDPRFRDGVRVMFTAQRTEWAKGWLAKLKSWGKPKQTTVEIPLDFGERPVDDIIQYRVGDVNILNPVTQLDTKCQIDRPKSNDRPDITFLAKWLVRNGFEVTRATVKQCYINAAPQQLLKAAGAWAE